MGAPLGTPEANERSWKLLDLLNEASSFFVSKGMEAARLQTELLLAAALGLNRLDLYLQFEKIVSAQEAEVFRGFVRERLKGKPLQYVTGFAAFRNLELSVGPGVLIPRPETEIVVEVALELLGEGQARILDLGCGSGAIAIAVCSECETVQAVASDIDRDALNIAVQNAQRHAVSESVAFVCGDLLEPFAGGTAPFDAIISNPPYVATAAIAGLQPEVRDFEPHGALDGGVEGLDFFQRIGDGAAHVLVAGGGLVLEVGDGQAEAVCGLLEATESYDQIESRCDLTGIQRVVSCRRR